MRKKIVSPFLLITFLCSAVAFAAKPPCTVSKHRDKWRIGYSKVDQLEVNANDQCTIKLECMESGLQRCRVKSANIYENFLDPNGTMMKAEDEDKIDGMVNELIENGEISGKFVFGGMALVIWSYNAENESIYTEFHNREMSKKLFNITF